VWARLRRRGVRTSRKRVLRLTRGAGLLAPTARVRKRAQRLHDGTITVTAPDTLWATDATEGWTEEGRCAVFVMIDHASGEAWADAGLDGLQGDHPELRDAMIETAKDGVNVKVAAEIIGVTAQTIHHWIKSGILPCVKFGPGITRIDPDELRKLRRVYPTEGGKP